VSNERQPILTHTDSAGAARMGDVTTKPATARTAVAAGSIRMTPATLTAIRDNQIAKGDVLGVARIAGIMAAKRTAELVPLCHTIPITRADVALRLDDAIPGVRAEATVSTTAPTGVEMEAIVAVSIALTTIYDMAKSADRGMVIGDIRLLSKSGGASGEYVREQPR
jgi:cyclic pyranopterin phosphate synthase